MPAAANNKDIKELHIDRAYLVSHWVKQRTSDMTILCKAWKVRNKFFEKHAFVLDWDNHLIAVPTGSYPLLKELLFTSQTGMSYLSYLSMHRK